MNDINLEELIKKLSLISPNKEKVELAVDLYDIFESSSKLEILINDIKSIKEKEILIEKLIEIEIELDHINWHYKSLKKDLKVLYKLTD
ncbi:hypothetical protein J7E71_18705 [Mesobacillus foraminis]|uniref:hypothetical protein n=1 Tax=Mesobacillus foraminis TaxID=279826 RepID=UPI001BEC4D8C|nr:hypothetical protein [Mesobacillus foraminis]MBT2757911.1 hypothetical protein [Mesobacillus foraminis]